jgi:uncharacterized protein
MSTVLITGGTGLIGTALSKELINKGYEIIILTRSPEKHIGTAKLQYAKWDVKKQFIDKEAFAKGEIIVHLAGENVGDKRWTKSRKKQILESRTLTSALLVKSLRETQNKIRTVISASGIGWYGEQKQARAFVETDPAAVDFLGTTCQQWEKTIEPVSDLGKRLVKFRIGVVLSNNGGAIEEFKPYLRLGIAPIISSGRQVVSWIGIQDLVRMIAFAIENEHLRGVYNAVAPYPVTNKTFVIELAKKLKGSFYIPIYVPSFAVKIMKGEVSIEVLKSSHVSAEKIRQAGFEFLHPTIRDCLFALFPG